MRGKGCGPPGPAGQWSHACVRSGESVARAIWNPRYARPIVSRRYRCNACGNLTRFTVTSVKRTRAFHHFTLGGELHIEEEEVLDEQVEDVSCRWCGNGKAIEVLAEGAFADGE